MAKYPQQHLADVIRLNGGNVDSRTGKVAQMIERGLRALWAADDTPRLTAHVSDAGKCPRALYFRMTGQASEPPALDFLVNITVGRAVEEWFIKAIKAAYPDAELYPEVEVMIPTEQRPTVPGHIDLLAIVPSENLAFECKSTNSKNMGYLISQRKEGQEDHRQQINLYQHAAKIGAPATFNGEPFDISRFADSEWRLAYIVKNATKGEPPIFDYLVSYDEEQALDDLVFLGLANTHARIGFDPGQPQGVKRTSFPCSYCDAYRAFCWQNKDVLVTPQPTTDTN